MTAGAPAGAPAVRGGPGGGPGGTGGARTGTAAPPEAATSAGSPGGGPGASARTGPGVREAVAARPDGVVPQRAGDGPAATAGADVITVGPAVDAVLAGLRRHARDLVADLAGPLRRVRLRSGDTVLEVEWHPPGVPPAGPGPDVAPTPFVPASPPPAASARHVVRAPIIGTFYRAPEPGAAPFVAVGDRIHPGQVVGIVEAMKLMNEVTADRAGRVAEILAGDGQPVEYDQPLLALDPA